MSRQTFIHGLFWIVKRIVISAVASLVVSLFFALMLSSMTEGDKASDYEFGYEFLSKEVLTIQGPETINIQAYSDSHELKLINLDTGDVIPCVDFAGDQCQIDRDIKPGHWRFTRDGHGYFKGYEALVKVTGSDLSLFNDIFPPAYFLLFTCILILCFVIAIRSSVNDSHLSF